MLATYDFDNLQAAVAFGWFFAVAMYGLVSYLPALQACTESSVCGPWSADEATAYYSLNRLMWGIWTCWLIWACSTGYGGRHRMSYWLCRQ